MSEKMADSSEVIANLWYVMDTHGFITSLRVHLYVADGTEDEKLSLLRSRAYMDFHVARVYGVPARFGTTIVEPGGEKTRYAVIHHDDAVRLGGIDQLFFDALDQWGAELAAQTSLKVPESPLTKITALVPAEGHAVMPLDWVR